MHEIMRQAINDQYSIPHFQDGGQNSTDDYDGHDKDADAEDFSNINEALTDESSRFEQFNFISNI